MAFLTPQKGSPGPSGTSPGSTTDNIVDWAIVGKLVQEQLDF